MSDYYPSDEARIATMPLFAARPPSVRGSQTSRAAARSLTAGTLTAMHRAVMAYLSGRPDGATDEEIAAGAGLNPSTERPRRIELQAAGLIVEAGRRRTRSGRWATVWRAATDGR